jgi:choline-glycine betaine transporter
MRTQGQTWTSVGVLVTIVGSTFIDGPVGTVVAVIGALLTVVGVVLTMPTNQHNSNAAGSTRPGGGCAVNRHRRRSAT